MFVNRVASLSARIKELREHITTEEATKNAFIQPFLQLLGYDPFDPRVVVPEYTADIGTKKKEKVDYVVLKDGDPIMLFECKTCGACLDSGKANQLHRYFSNTPTARVGVLTDGIVYEFYSDLDKPNIMDSRPFMVFDFDKVDESLIPELEKLALGKFDEDNALSAAQNLKYTRQIKRMLAEELKDPSDSFVRLFAAQIHPGQLRANVVEEFRGRVSQAAKDLINEKIDERLKSAMTRAEEGPLDDSEEVDVLPEESTTEEGGPKIVTTDEEMEAFFVVKSILREVIDISRVAIRDRQSYCGILLDDNNRKPICRFHFNTSKWYLGVFDEGKNETRKSIESLDDIYMYASQLKATVAMYDA